MYDGKASVAIRQSKLQLLIIHASLSIHGFSSMKLDVLMSTYFKITHT